MIYADLHIHSSFSDGILSPEEIINISVEKKLKYISITDHDSIKAMKCINNYRSDIDLISGVELSSRYNDNEVHILGYFLDIFNKKLNDTLGELKEKRIQRAKEILIKLKKYDINLTLDELPIEKSTVGRGNIAQLMISKNYVKNNYEAFSKYLGKDKCAYIHGEKLGVKEAIGLILESGGLPVLAHPGKIYRNIEFEKMIKEFKSFGLRGMEVFHPSHSRDKTNYFYNMSIKHKMIITGGSDYHGNEGKSGDIGAQGISKELIEKFMRYEKW